ncbi:MAG: CAP domain-containing protein [Planctomycetota bacterium]
MHASLRSLLLAVAALAALAAFARASDDDEVAADPEALAAAFLDAEGEARDVAYAELDGRLDPERIDALLVERANRAVRALQKGSAMSQLERLAKIRKELDEARGAVLEIVEDSERYFTPYKVPEVSPDRAAEYIQVQREIDDHKRTLADIWDEKKKAKLPKGFRAALEDLAWTNALQLDRKTTPSMRRRRKKPDPIPLPEGLPEWILGVDASLDKVTLREFAWSASERDALALSRGVMEFNEARMTRAMKAKKELTDAQRPSKSEIEQVRITNEYRLMLGRRALAWDPRLQDATDHHSNYQSKWGVLTHFEEKDQEHYDLGKRTKLAGYPAGRGENCSMGRADPKGTHDAWCSSSGHHRNLVAAGHTEMASAVAGNYWTQNFGGRPVKAEDLDSESDWPAANR